MRRNHGADRRLGEKRRRMGDNPPLQAMRQAKLEPHRSGRQPGQAHVDRAQAFGRAAVSVGSYRKNAELVLL